MTFPLAYYPSSPRAHQVKEGNLGLFQGRVRLKPIPTQRQESPQTLPTATGSRALHALRVPGLITPLPSLLRAKHTLHILLRSSVSFPGGARES